jgi:hypothetical protein
MVDDAGRRSGAAFGGGALVKRALIVCVLTLAACAGADAPTGFGVDLTITLSPSVRASISRVKVHVSGAETYDVPALPASVFPDGTARIRYVPAAKTGTLTFAATGFDGQAHEAAFGSSGAVVLSPGKAVLANITLNENTGVTSDMAIGDMTASGDGDVVGVSDMTASLPVLSVDHQPGYDFGTVLVNATSSAATFTVKNAGTAPSSALGPAKLTGTGAAAYSIQTDNCSGMTLAPAATCTVVVVLGPTAAGTPSATLTISADEGGAATVMLTGKVVTPGAIGLSASPNASPVATVPSGSVTFNVTVANSGGVATGPITWGFTGDASSDYSVIGGSCTPSQTLGPSASCMLSVRFQPSTTGPRNATLTVMATPGGPGVLQLTGTGIVPANVSFTQASYGAGTVAVGTSGTITLTLQNTGTVPSPALPATVQTNGHTLFTYQAGGTCTLGMPIAGNSTCTIEVKFTPTTFGSVSDMLALNVTGPISSTVTGTGQQTFTVSVTNMGATGTDQITSNPAAIVCGNGGTTCSQQYVVTTTAPSITLSPTTVDANSRFVGFTGACTNASTCSLTVDGSKSVTASWQATYTATVTVIGPGTVTSTGSPAFNCTASNSPCTNAFDVGSSIALSETPTSPATFSGWSSSGGGCSGTNSCSLTSAHSSVTASFGCPAISSTAYVDHTSGVDAVGQGGGSGVCAFKTLKYALANGGYGTFSLNGSDTYPGGVAGEPGADDAAYYTLQSTQKLSCNGAKIAYEGTMAGTTSLIVLAGSNNSVDHCDLDSIDQTSSATTAIYFDSGIYQPTITNNVFNSGFYFVSGYVSASGTTTFSGNTVKCGGGTMFVNGGTMTMSGNTFNCTASTPVQFGGTSKGTVDSNTFISGVNIGLSMPNGTPTVSLTNNSFSSTSANGDIYCGTSGQTGISGSGNYEGSNTSQAPTCHYCAGCPFH